MPGFVDTHAHAPQYPNAGTCLDKPLFEWLEDCTYPITRRFSEKSFAEAVYLKAVKRFIDNGTTTAVYYGTGDPETGHVESNRCLANIVKDKGQRAFIGKVDANRFDCKQCKPNEPNDCKPNENDCRLYKLYPHEPIIKKTEEFINYVLGLEESDEKRLVYPIITPGFAIACTPELMKGLGKLAENRNVPITTHLSESLSEVDRTSELFPGLDHATVYYEHGLLNEKTILAHGIYLSTNERNLIKKQKSGISHCPTSNFDLTSGVCKVRRLLDDGVKVGLGTDLSGGHSTSMLVAMRNASIASRVVSLNDRDRSQLTTAELTYLATLGGAELVNLENKIGNFKEGKEFDALLIDPEVTIDIFDKIDNINRIFEKFIFLGDDRNIISVYVKGNQIKKK